MQAVSGLRLGLGALTHPSRPLTPYPCTPRQPPEAPRLPGLPRGLCTLSLLPRTCAPAEPPRLPLRYRCQQESPLRTLSVSAGGLRTALGTSVSPLPSSWNGARDLTGTRDVDIPQQTMNEGMPLMSLHWHRVVTFLSPPQIPKWSLLTATPTPAPLQTCSKLLSNLDSADESPRGSQGSSE